MQGPHDSFDVKELHHCLQCAICTGSCPVSRVIEGFNPRELVLRYVLYGEKDEVIDTDVIWCCTTCQVCRERCPHEIDISGFLIFIMNQAAKRQKCPEAHKKQIARIAETGRAVAATSRSERIRSELGLKPLTKRDNGEIKRILHAAGIRDIADKKNPGS